MNKLKNVLFYISGFFIGLRWKIWNKQMDRAIEKYYKKSNKKGK